MIDSNFSNQVYSNKPATKYNTFLPDILRFNPYESIPGKTPISCYETLAIMNDLDVVPCCRNIVPGGIVCADLDETEGFSIAITGRLKSSLIYGLCNTKSKRKWDFAKSGLQSSRFDLNSSCSRTLVANVCRDDPRGIGLSYLTLTDKSDVELLCEMRCVVHVLATEGSCLIRISNFNNSTLRRYLSPLKDIFETLVFYKPAVTPCMEPICYAVGIRRIAGKTYRTPHSHADQFVESELTKMELHRQRCIASVAERIDNTKNANVSRAKAQYINVEI